MKVLYVDDDDDIREIAGMSLGLDPELEVQTCDSGSKALETARHWRPDLVFLDVMMPGMDGPETLNHLRGDPETCDLPIVFVTARTQSSEIEHFLSLGARDVVSKPFDPMSFADRAKDFIAKR